MLMFFLHPSSIGKHCFLDLRAPFMRIIFRWKQISRWQMPMLFLNLSLSLLLLLSNRYLLPLYEVFVAKNSCDFLFSSHQDIVTAALLHILRLQLSLRKSLTLIRLHLNWGCRVTSKILTRAFWVFFASSESLCDSLGSVGSVLLHWGGLWWWNETTGSVGIQSTGYWTVGNCCISAYMMRM